jgi:hypothetical protein
MFVPGATGKRAGEEREEADDPREPLPCERCVRVISKYQGEAPPRTDSKPARTAAFFRGPGGFARARTRFEPVARRHALLLLRRDGPDAVGPLPGVCGSKRCKGHGPCDRRRPHRLLQESHPPITAGRREGCGPRRGTVPARSDRYAGGIRPKPASHRSTRSVERIRAVASSAKTCQRSPRTIDGLPDVS